MDKKTSFKRALRVLFLGNIPSPYAIDFYNELGKLCDLTVLYERKSANDREKEWFTGIIKDYKAIFLPGIKTGNESAFCPSVIKYLINPEFDVILVGGYSTPTGILSILTLKAIKRKFFFQCDGGMKTTEGKFKEVLKRFLLSSACVWFSSGDVTDEYLLYYGAKKEKIYRYPFTSLMEIDIAKNVLDDNEKRLLKTKLGISEKKMVLSVGQFIERKGYDVLLKSCCNLDKDIGVYIVGGEPTEEYIRLKKNLHLSNIHFFGLKTKEQLKEYYSVADLFVLPTRKDVWGLVINEAMAMGLPVITTDQCVAGLELIRDCENGFIVPADDSKLLREKMDIILNDGALRGSMSKNNLIKIAPYTIENVARIHAEVIDLNADNK